jgi:hypothetical protein
MVITAKEKDVELFVALKEETSSVLLSFNNRTTAAYPKLIYLLSLQKKERKLRL